MKRTGITKKTVTVLSWIVAVIWILKLVLLLVVDSRDALYWALDAVCAVLWVIAAVVNTMRWKSGN